MSVASARPRLRVFAGPNGSGKSTIQDLLQPEWIGSYVNADDIEKALREPGRLPLADYGLNLAPDLLQARLRSHLAESTLLRKSGMAEVSRFLDVDAARALRVPAALINSYVASALADAIRRELMGQGITFTFETVMSSPDKVDFMRQARAHGYRTYLYFVATDDPAINVERVKLRVIQGGHDVPEDKIRARYTRSIALLDAACAAADRAYIFDNSGQAHQWIAELTNGDELRLHVSALPAWFAGTSLWRSFQTA